MAGKLSISKKVSNKKKTPPSESMTYGEGAKLKLKKEKANQKAQDKSIQNLSPKKREEYYKNVDKFTNAPLGRYMDGMPIKRNPTIEQLRHVEKASRAGHAVDLSSPQRAKVIAHKRHVLEDDPPKKVPTKVKKAGGGMTGVGLYPAEMARAGTMSQAKRKRYMKKGGGITYKMSGGQVVSHGYDK